MAELQLISLGVNVANVIILLPLLFIYLRNYRYIKSKCNLGLIIFSSFFLLQNLAAVYMGIFIWPAVVSDLLYSNIVTLNAIQFFGLIALFYVTWR
jgi:hypothetical protein